MALTPAEGIELITVRFFASLAEQLGRREIALADGAGLSVAEVWERAGQGPRPALLRCARNQAYCAWEDTVQDGDEVAFFPPVTGG